MGTSNAANGQGINGMGSKSTRPSGINAKQAQ